MNVKTIRSVDLKDIIKLKEFVNEMTYFGGDVNAVRGSYCVDASSILGLLSYDLSKPVDLELISDEPEIVNKFEEICKRYA